MDNIRTKNGAPDTFFGITPSDTVKLQGLQYLFVTTGGTLKLKGTAPDAVVRTWTVTAGQFIPFGAGYVMATGTTAVVDGMA